jgi:putative transposase
MKKRILKMCNKTKNRVTDIHCKLSNEICQENYDILISKFRVSEMVKKINRKIGKDATRKMLGWSHYKFRQRLFDKSEEYQCIVHEVSEHYTSKTCGKCGNVNYKLGSSKIFTCPACGFILDRDWNGARNIFIMNVEKIGRITINPRLSADEQGAELHSTDS